MSVVNPETRMLECLMIKVNIVVKLRATHEK